MRCIANLTFFLAAIFASLSCSSDTQRGPLAPIALSVLNGKPKARCHREDLLPATGPGPYRECRTQSEAKDTIVLVITNGVEEVVLVSREWISDSEGDFIALEKQLVTSHGSPGRACLDEAWDPALSWRTSTYHVVLGKTRSARKTYYAYMLGPPLC